MRFLAFADDRSVVLMDLVDGSTSTVPNSGDCIGSNPNWSPDGKYLVVLCRSNHEISLLALADGAKVTLVNDPDESGNSDGFSNLSLSPDGRWVAYYAWLKSGESKLKGLYVAELSCLAPGLGCDSNTHLLISPSLPGATAWSKDNHIAFVDYNTIQVYKVPDALTVKSYSAPQPGVIDSVLLSPIDRRIAFVQDYGLYIASPEEGKTFKLSPENVYVDSLVAWIAIP